MYDSFMPKTAALTDNAKKEIAQLLEDYATGVESTQSAINSYVEEGRGDNFIKDLDLSVSSVFGQKNSTRRLVAKQTIGILQEASRRLLVATRLSSRVSVNLAFEILRDEIGAERGRTEGKKQSYFKVIDRAIDIIRAGWNIDASTFFR